MGMQGDDLTSHEKAIALLCHFPGQAEPVSGLERGAMEISERKLREVFLPSWVAGIKKSGALGSNGHISGNRRTACTCI